MRSTTRGSVIKETIFIWAPQLQRSGSTSKIFRSKRARGSTPRLREVGFLVGWLLRLRALEHFPLAGPESRTGSVGEGPVIPDLMPAGIGDVGGAGMDPVEGVEGTSRGAGARVRGRIDLEAAVLLPPETGNGEGRASDVAGHALELLRIVGCKGVAGEDRESRMHESRAGCA